MPWHILLIFRYTVIVRASRIESRILGRDTLKTVFICTNVSQRIGALVAQYALKKNSKTPDDFRTVLLENKDFDFLAAKHGERYLRQGRTACWDNTDLQSFTPLRFIVPEMMGYEGQALVIDPDIFAVSDVVELLNRDMGDAAILCRRRPGKGSRPSYFASSVMLLNCEKLRHWRCAENFDEMFRFERDYSDWMRLRLEPEDSIGLFEDGWNDFDTLNGCTRMLHNTNRKTQPWKTGLPLEFQQHKTKFLAAQYVVLKRRLQNAIGFVPRHQAHPDPAQERLFFDLLGDAIANNAISNEMVAQAIEQGYLRSDAMALVARGD